jgi:hypothetical protein
LYKFKSEAEEKKFNDVLNRCLSLFEKEFPKRKLRVIKCNLQIIYLAQLNEMRGVKWYFENIDYHDFLTLTYLNRLCESGLWEFTEYEKSYFLNKHL